MPYFAHNGITLHYIDVDKRSDKTEGIPLLFIHGGGASHLAWFHQLDEFSYENRSIAIDLSGHGKSDTLNGDITIEQHFVEEVSALVKHLDLDDFVLIGHSMGGCIAMSYVLKRNAVKPRALVLVDTSSDIDLLKISQGLVKEAFENHKSTRLTSVTLLMRDLAICRKFDITDRLGEIDLPTFVIVGEDDDVIPPHVAKALCDALPRADIAVVRGADHVPMSEQPVEFNRLLKKFLKWVISAT
jgi:pimeloyl-ACP methyl ester carboxylesterase